VQQLRIYQSLWGMELRSPGVPERSQEECFGMVADAGFDGMCIDPTADEIAELRGLRGLYRDSGLGCMVNAFPHTADDMLPLLDFANEMDACMVNVISGVMPLRPEDAVPVVQHWIREAAERDMPLLFETHRDGMLNDMYYTLLLMDLVPDMRLCADLSHFVVDREMRNPIGARDQQYVSRILERSDCFQGRVASREQVQVQINFPQHQEWVGIFRSWWREGMQSWHARNPDNAQLVFLCELGPPPYAITDANQQELSDRWQESLQIRDWAMELWADTTADSG
jgi:hypothetical protein